MTSITINKDEYKLGSINEQSEKIHIIKLSEQQELQPLSSIAFMGSVGAGKTTICTALTKNTTQKHSKEKINGCTIKMGYTNIAIYFDNNGNYLVNPSIVPSEYSLIRHFSIADNPGHNSYLPTLLTGCTDIDIALFLISGCTPVNESISELSGIEPQSRQHIKCFKTFDKKTDIAFIVSKLDLIPTKNKLDEIITNIYKLMEDEGVDDEIDPPIIPLSSISGININYLIKYLVSKDYPKNLMSRVNESFIMTILRSFNINKPGSITLNSGTNSLNDIDDYKGGVFGGAIKKGYLCIGDIICILPGIVRNDGENTIYTPLVTQVVSIRSEISDLNVALPGGFIAVSTTLDPSYSVADNMVGQIIIKVDNLDNTGNIVGNSKIVNKISVSNISYLNDISKINNETLEIDNEYFVIIHAAGQLCVLESINDDIYSFKLNEPIAISNNEKIAILKKGTIFEMQAYGTIILLEPYIDNLNIIMELPSDIDEFFSNLPITKTIESIIVIDDLPKYSELYNPNDELYNIDEMVTSLTFKQKEFNINIPSAIIDTDITSLTINNIIQILQIFTNNHKSLKDLKDKFQLFFKNQYSSIMKNVIIHPYLSNNYDFISGNVVGLTFNNIKNAHKKFKVPDINKIINKFIINHLSCNTCKSIGSMFYNETEFSCKSCLAIASTY